MKKTSFFLYLVSGLTIAVISVYGFLLLRDRPGIPVELQGRTFVRVNGVGIETKKDLDFALSGKRIGDMTAFVVGAGSGAEEVRARLEPFYSSAPFPLIFFLIGACGFAIGVMVFVLRPGDPRALIFYWAALCFSSSLIVNGDYYCVRDRGMTLVPGVLFNFAYPMVAALLLHFSLTFSPVEPRRRRLVLYLPPLAFGGLLNFTFLDSVLRSSQGVFRLQLKTFIVFRWYFLAYSLAAVVLLVIFLRRAQTKEERARIQWIFFGLCVGLAPFLFFYQFPQAAGLGPVLSEELTSVFFLAIPLAFAISIVKHRLMDVDLVINRSVVYAVLTVLTVSIYLVSIEFLQRFFSRLVFAGEQAGSIGAAVLAAAAFHPLRKKVQGAVDKAFFRQRYDYRKSIRSFGEAAQKMFDPSNLAGLFTAKVMSTVPLEDVGISVSRERECSRESLLARGFEKEPALAGADVPSARVLARKHALASRDAEDGPGDALLAHSRFEVLVPLPFSSPSFSGFAALGRKLSGERYTEDDLDLFVTLAGDLATNLERIWLQQEVIYERASREKADELNRLKTEFISSVSHELRTPMNSIQGLSELLESGKIKEDEKKEKLLRLMASECGRLSRFIHNVLDFGKIEQKAESYNFQRTALQPVIEEVVKLCGFGQAEVVIRVSLPAEPVLLDIDPDAVKQALMNLVDNAIKYSTAKKEVAITLLQGEKEAEVRVNDRGVGVPPEEQEKIFEAFYRSPRGAEVHPGGVGLGLKIVRHIMTAHGGAVRLLSVPGQGSTFSLVFPKP